MTASGPTPGPSVEMRVLEGLSRALADAEAAFDALPIAYYRADEDGRILRTNEVFRRLVQGHGAEGGAILEAYRDPRDFDRLIDDLEDAGGYLIRVVELANGRRVEERAALRDGPGDRVVDAVFLDVTEQVAFERELDRNARMLDRANVRLRRHVDLLDTFTYGVSHDLKTPVRGIDAYVDALEEDLEEAGVDVPPEVMGYVAGIRQNVDRMDRMIGGLLEMAKFQRIPTEGVSNADAILDDVLQGHAHAMGGVRVHREGRLPEVPIGEDALAGVLTNLVGNAIKYADVEEPQVTISAERRGNEWVFTVADNGPGVPRELRESVFNLFFRAPGEKVEGSGVGLAVVRLLVEGWNGSVWVEKSSMGGAAFRFTVPLNDAP